ncbi:MAG: hypothetical protein AAF657_07200 [Acidobacteriota bacterium]
MSVDIQPADPRRRVRFLLAMVSFAFLIALGLLYLDAYLRDLHGLAQNAQPLAAAKAERVVQIVFGLLACGALALSLYLGRTSWRTLQAERYPPPDARVISDTRIRRGPAARRQGQLGLVLAVLTFVLAIVVLFLAHRLLQPLLDSSLKPTPFSLEEP